MAAAEDKDIRTHVLLVDGHRGVAASTAAAQRLADEEDQLIGGHRVDGQQRGYSVGGDGGGGSGRSRRAGAGAAGIVRVSIDVVLSGIQVRGDDFALKKKRFEV